MTGINQGRPEMAIGEPIRLGSNNDFEIEQHPVSDRLIIRDTVNGKVAYVRKERGGQIGGDGVLVKALKEGKPVADDGRTHDTIQAAERAASGWVFVPPGTFNESVEITTEGLTLRGSGYNTLIDGGSLGIDAININADNCTLKDVATRTDSGQSREQNAVDINSKGCRIIRVSVKNADGRGINGGESVSIINCRIESTDIFGISAVTNNSIVVGCNITGTAKTGISIAEDGTLVSNNVIYNVPGGMFFSGSSYNQIIIGNRIINPGGTGIKNGANDTIIANNRVSDSSNDIDDSGTNTLLDGNLTGASN